MISHHIPMTPDFHISEDMTLGAGISQHIRHESVLRVMDLVLKSEIDRIICRLGVPADVMKSLLPYGRRTACEILFANMHRFAGTIY